MSDRFSYSRVDVFSQCGFKYKLRYVDKHYVNSDSLATELGSAIHKTEEAIANTIASGGSIDYIGLKNKLILTYVELEHKYAEAFMTADKSNRTCKDKLFEYLTTGIYRLENFLMANQHLKVIATEKEFEFTIFETVFHGFIDRVLYDTKNNKYIVQDIKTYPVPVEKKNLAVPLQFVIYSLAMKELYGVDPADIECSYDLPFCNIIQKAGEADFVAKGVEKLHELLNSIDNNDFVPKPTPLCHWCEYCPTNPNQEEAAKNLCPYYSLWTRENKTHQVACKWEGIENHELVLFEYIKCQNNKQKAV